MGNWQPSWLGVSSPNWQVRYSIARHVAADHLSLSFVIHDVLLAVLLSCKLRHCPKELLVNPSYGQLQPYLQLGGPNIAMQPTQ